MSLRNIFSLSTTGAALLLLGAAAVIVHPALWAVALGVGCFVPEVLSGLE